MRYTFRPLPELYWALVTGVGIVLFQALLTLEPEQVTDWQTWAVALGGALVRAVGGAGIDYLRRSMTAEPEPEPHQKTAYGYVSAEMDYPPEFVDAVAEALLRKRAEQLAERFPDAPPVLDRNANVSVKL